MINSREICKPMEFYSRWIHSFLMLYLVLEFEILCFKKCETYGSPLNIFHALTPILILIVKPEWYLLLRTGPPACLVCSLLFPWIRFSNSVWNFCHTLDCSQIKMQRHIKELKVIFTTLSGIPQN